MASTGNGQTTIAPGSYVSVYGTSLTDPGYIDSAGYTPLPLTIDGATVSFDVALAVTGLGALLFAQRFLSGLSARHSRACVDFRRQR